MITSSLEGGLGNMLFQIAATEALAFDNDDVAIFKSQEQCDGCDIHWTGRDYYRDNILSRVEFADEVVASSVYSEPHFHYAKIPYRENVKLLGYFQSEKYFKHHKNKIKDLFAPTNNILEYINNKYPIINNPNTVGIHVRRGNYTRLANDHPVCGKEYYTSALSRIVADVKDYTIIICSDDTEWCTNAFSKNVHIITGEKDYIDMYILAMCNNNIIANSSFSWWGAWLNNTIDKKVIAPKIWFGPAKGMISTKDIYCSDWTVL